MKGFAIVTGFIVVAGSLVSCSESEEATPREVMDVTNTTLATNMQGGWIHIENEQRNSYQGIDLRFEGNRLIWKDSTVNTEGKYAVIRSGSCDVKYLKNDPEVVKKYLMGRPPLTNGVKDVLVSDWRGSKSINRNYRNTNPVKGWELINEWESASGQPPIPDAVYVLTLDANEVMLEIDGDKEDFQELYSRSQ